jgi:Uma2 family endonuclease
MTPATTPPATLDDLAKVEGKAELINGRIVHLMSSGVLPARVARRILRSLDDYAASSGVGEAFGDNLAYAFRPPLPALPTGRRSLSPDASYYSGPLPPNLFKFVDGPPTFAVEVRSEHDYGPAMDREYEDKRKDYFFAGTQVVWDVDPKAETITVYRISDPLTPVVFRRGDTADAEPAVPGWRLKVDDLFA